MEQIQIGNMIAKRRKQLSLTQQQIADALGVTNKAVSKWETGEGYPDITCIPALAEVLQISIDELLTGNPNEALCQPKQKKLPFTEEECIHEFITMKPVSIFLTLIGIILAFCFWVAWQNFAWSFGVCGVLTAVSLFCRYVAFNECKNRLKSIDHASVNLNEFKAEEYQSILWIVWIGITPLCYMIIREFLIGYLLNPASELVYLFSSWVMAIAVSTIITVILKKEAKSLLH